MRSPVWFAMNALAASGGRPASQPDRLTTITGGESAWIPKSPQPSEARLTIVQITDVYTLGNFASIKTLLKETREKTSPGKVVSVLTGDFLSPYLLSSIDRGAGMMNALCKTPIDYLTWGNHEADIDHRTVCNHVKKFSGVWINTNMQDHEAMDHQKPFEIIEIESPDGTHKRKIGLIAVLSNDPGLYKQFRFPGAFGGASIQDPWETLREYKDKLEKPPYNCDMIIPLQHLYVPDDHKTCEMFDFPLILSGHDHHRVDEIHMGTRLLKPGLDAVYAAVVDISWEGSEAADPLIQARFVKTSDWEPDVQLQEENIRAYDALLPLRKTELARVPPTFRPLSSVNARGRVCSMGRLLCTLLRSAINAQRRTKHDDMIDAVLLMGGNVRGGTDYPSDCFFSLEALEAEVKSNEVIAVVPMPGWVLAKGIIETHSGEPIPGWLQYDDGVKEECPLDKAPFVSCVASSPLEPERIYLVATKVSDLTNGQCPAFTDYYTKHPEALPPKGAYVNIHAELMGYFARNLWRKVWEALEPKMKVHEPTEECDFDCASQERMELLDLNHDGTVSRDEIHTALRDVLHLSVHDAEKSLASFVHSFADVDGDGKVTLADLEAFCHEIPKIYASDKWRLAYPRSAAFASQTQN